jgi:predicted nucleic acid-binding protein
MEYILKYELSTLDSLHLVSSISASEIVAEKSKIIFISSDEELCKAAEKEGFKIINPEKEKLEAVERLLEKDL